MKIVALVLLLVGLVGIGLGAYEYFDSYQANRGMARTHLDRAEGLKARAQAARGTPEEAALVADLNKYTGYAAESNRAADSAMTRVMMYAIGGLVLGAAGALMFTRPRRKAGAGLEPAV